MCQSGAPVKSQPAHIGHDGVDVLGTFFEGICIVKAHETLAPIDFRYSKVQADRFCMANVKVPVRLGRKACGDR